MVLCSREDTVQLGDVYPTFNKHVQHCLQPRKYVKAELNYSLLVDQSDMKCFLRCDPLDNLPVKDSESHFSHKLTVLLVDWLRIVYFVQFIVH